MLAVMEENMFRGLREVAALSLLASALFLLISLVTFNLEDAGWTHSGTTRTISNACGLMGAWIADLGLSLFGLTAYLFPIILVWQSYLLYGQIKHKREKIIICWLGFSINISVRTFKINSLLRLYSQSLEIIVL